MEIIRISYDLMSSCSSGKWRGGSPLIGLCCVLNRDCGSPASCLALRYAELHVDQSMNREGWPWTTCILHFLATSLPWLLLNPGEIRELLKSISLVFIPGASLLMWCRKPFWQYADLDLQGSSVFLWKCLTMDDGNQWAGPQLLGLWWEGEDFQLDKRPVVRSGDHLSTPFLGWLSLRCFTLPVPPLLFSEITSQNKLATYKPSFPAMLLFQEKKRPLNCGYTASNPVTTQSSIIVPL